MTILLSELLRDFIEEVTFSDANISQLCENSKEVSEGSLFIAIQGETVDGHIFVKDALSKGAVAALVEKEVEIPSSEQHKLIYVESTKALLPHLAKRLYGRNLQTILNLSFGITGTNGKTTIAYLLEEILHKSSFTPAIIGTVGNRCGNFFEETPYTTPKPITLWKSLKNLQSHGANSLVMEVSSHALEQNRVGGISFDVAGFTNISQDHLDFHGTMENYLAAKMKLFSVYLNKAGTAVLNQDSTYFDMLAKQATGTVLGYSTSKQSADFFASDIQLTPQGTEALVKTPEGKLALQTPMIGSFNLENVLCAAAMAFAGGVPLKTIFDALKTISPPPGRLEKVPTNQAKTVFVDYAHTPDALEKVLSVLQPLCQGKLVVVMGCGGDRDRSKRPIMGAAACQHADVTIITSDNPRSEEPMSIINDILPGLTKQNKEEKVDYFIEVDRRKAIALAISIASQQDIVLIAGKGHESYQIIKGKKLNFNDKLVAQEELEKLN